MTSTAPAAVPAITEVVDDEDGTGVGVEPCVGSALLHIPQRAGHCLLNSFPNCTQCSTGSDRQKAGSARPSQVAAGSVEQCIDLWEGDGLIWSAGQSLQRVHRTILLNGMSTHAALTEYQLLTIMQCFQ